MIVIVDSGVANLASVQAALSRLQAEHIVSADPTKIAAADRVILPGVGAAPTAMASLCAKGLVQTLQALQQPVLGICLGMQLMFERSEEGEGAACLGVLPGTGELLPGSKQEPIPHMGWNQISAVQSAHPLLKGLPAAPYVYFVHSFAVPVGPATVASATYSKPFTALAAQGNFMGCQFHPERSGEVGSLILRNFLEL